MITTHVSTSLTYALLATLAITAIIASVSVPAKASAALFGYVDTAGILRSVDATDWQAALRTAPGIHMHSGVMLLNTAARLDLVGERI